MRPSEYFHEAFRNPRYHFAFGVILVLASIFLFQMMELESAAILLIGLALGPLIETEIWIRGSVRYSFGPHSDYVEDDPERDAFQPVDALPRYLAWTILSVGAYVLGHWYGYAERAGPPAVFLILLIVVALAAWTFIDQRRMCREFSEKTGLELRR